MAQILTVAKVGEIEPEDSITVDVNGVSVAVFNSGGKYYAVGNTCCHRGGPLAEGTIDGTMVTCPWHGWEFDLSTGKCLNNPGACVPAFEVRIEGNSIQLVVS